MIPPELEILIAQYADGTLPAERRDALEEVLRRDAAARALLDEYRGLDRVLKAALPAPALGDVEWDRLAGRISDAVSKQTEAPSADRAAIPEVVEFAIAQYADGTLADAERPAIEARLADDPAARALRRAYEAVDAIAKQAPLPAVRWPALAAYVSGAVAAQADGVAAGLPEELEFQIAQYADGTLPAGQRAEVEVRLASDPAARLVLAEYAQLGSALKQALPLPDVRWEGLAEHLSAAVNRQGVAAEERQRSRFRLFAPRPMPAWLALAASVIIALGVGLRLVRTTPKPHGGQDGQIAEVTTPKPVPTGEVIGPTIEVAEGAPVVEIEIGGPAPGSAGAVASNADYGGDDVVSRPTRSVVASGTASAVAYQDSAYQPF
jgi:anti-sigma factor RsiW